MKTWLIVLIVFVALGLLSAYIILSILNRALVGNAQSVQSSIASRADAEEGVMLSNREKFLRYLEAYAAMDIDGVADMLAEDVLLRDWKISVRGKAEALRETQKNFDASTSIVIDTLRLYESNNVVVGELKITVNGADVLYVTDIVTFDSVGKIASIRAYIGRED